MVGIGQAHDAAGIAALCTEDGVFFEKMKNPQSATRQSKTLKKILFS